jgi:hypothetical protein
LVEKAQLQIAENHKVPLMKNKGQESLVQGMLTKMKGKKAKKHHLVQKNAKGKSKEEGFEEYMLKDITEKVAEEDFSTENQIPELKNTNSN